MGKWGPERANTRRGDGERDGKLGETKYSLNWLTQQILTRISKSAIVMCKINTKSKRWAKREETKIFK